jgi:hypothetical protein
MLRRRFRPHRPHAPLSRNRTRMLVFAFVVLILCLAALAAITITRGLEDEQLQEQLRELRGQDP